jgi:hypothetical protein
VGISRRDEEGRSGKRRRRDNNNEFVKNTGTSPSIHSTQVHHHQKGYMGLENDGNRDNQFIRGHKKRQQDR